MSTEILNIFLEIFILILLGFLFTKTKVITGEMKQYLNAFLVHVLVPVAIINASQAEFNVEHVYGYLLAFLFSLISDLIMVLGIPPLLKRFGVKEDKAKMTGMMLGYTNSGFIGFPIAQTLYGDTGLLYAVGYNMAMNLSLFSVGAMTLESSGKMSFKSFFQTVIKNITILSALLAFVLYLLPFRFPETVHTAFSMVSDMMAPLSLLIIGYELAQMKLSELFLEKSSYAISIMRLLILPILMLIVLRTLNINVMVIRIVVLMTALPSAALNVIFADQYHCAARFTAVCVTQTMLFMIFTTPFIVSILNTLPG